MSVPMKAIDPKALFRLSVIGPLVSRERLARGELQQIVRELAQREYDITGSRRRHLGEKTIEGRSYAYRRQGIEGLLPNPRSDRGQCKLPLAVQQIGRAHACTPVTTAHLVCRLMRNKNNT